MPIALRACLLRLRLARDSNLAEDILADLQDNSLALAAPRRDSTQAVFPRR